MHMHSCSSYSQKGSCSPLLPAVPSTAAAFPLWMAMDSLCRRYSLLLGSPVIRWRRRPMTKD